MLYRMGMTEVPAVTRQDVATLLKGLRPGSVHPAADLYARFIRNLEGTYRPVPHAVALGHALAAAGCERKRVRTAKGRRGNQKPVETACWVIPGVPLDESPDPLAEFIKELTPGVYSEDEVWRRYKLMYWNRGWGPCDLPRQTLLRQLTPLGHPLVKDGNKRTRVF